MAGTRCADGKGRSAQVVVDAQVGLMAARFAQDNVYICGSRFGVGNNLV